MIVRHLVPLRVASYQWQDILPFFLSQICNPSLQHSLLPLSISFKTVRLPNYPHSCPRPSLLNPNLNLFMDHSLLLININWDSRSIRTIRFTNNPLIRSRLLQEERWLLNQQQWVPSGLLVTFKANICVIDSITVKACSMDPTILL